MPGTELTPDRRADLVRSLTVVGWLLLGAPFGFIAFQLERVRGVGEQQFASVWEQRIEVLSFLVLPPNLVVLAPAVFVAAVATWLSVDRPEAWLATLLRVAAGLAVVYVAIGGVSIISLMVSDDAGPGDFESVMLRLGGVSLAAGLALLCRTADRLST